MEQKDIDFIQEQYSRIASDRIIPFLENVGNEPESQKWLDITIQRLKELADEDMTEHQVVLSELVEEQNLAVNSTPKFFDKLLEVAESHDWSMLDSLELLDNMEEYKEGKEDLLDIFVNYMNDTTFAEYIEHCEKVFDVDLYTTLDKEDSMSELEELISKEKLYDELIEFLSSDELDDYIDQYAKENDIYKMNDYPYYLDGLEIR